MSMVTSLLYCAALLAQKTDAPAETPTPKSTPEATLAVHNDFMVPITVLTKPVDESEWKQTELAVGQMAEVKMPPGNVDLILRTVAGNEYHRANFDPRRLMSSASRGAYDFRDNFRWGAWIWTITPEGPARQFRWKTFFPTHVSFNVHVTPDSVLVSRWPPATSPVDAALPYPPPPPPPRLPLEAR